MKNLLVVGLLALAGCCAAPKSVPLQTVLLSYSNTSHVVENPFDVPVFLYVNGKLSGAIEANGKTTVETISGRGYNFSITADPEIYERIRKASR